MAWEVWEGGREGRRPGACTGGSSGESPLCFGKRRRCLASGVYCPVSGVQLWRLLFKIRHLVLGTYAWQVLSLVTDGLFYFTQLTFPSIIVRYIYQAAGQQLLGS